MAQRTPFEEDSDNGSVNTTSTEESDEDPEKEYEVESILAERLGHNTNDKWYLIKWAGYPLHLSTWEGAENIYHENLLNDWAERQRLAQEGKAKLFDVTEYEEAVEREGERKERKRERRRAKRQQRADGLFMLDDGERDGSGDDLPTTAAPARTRAQQTSPVKRKGVAQRVTRPRKKPTLVVQSDEDEDDDMDDLFDGSLPHSQDTLAQGSQRPTHSGNSIVESRPTTASRKAVTSQKPASVPKPATPAKPTTASKAAPISRIATASGSKTGTVQQPPTQKTATAQTHAGPSAVSSAAAKSANSKTTGEGPMLKRSKNAPVNVFAGDWMKPKKRRGSLKANDDPSKPPSVTNFRNLSIQHKVQIFGRNEPPPNPDAVGIVDPKTGKVQPAPARPDPLRRQTTGEIHSAYGRRSPPRVVRQRSAFREPEELAGEQRRRADMPTEQSARDAPSSAVQQPQQTFDFRTFKVCRDWLTGTCRYTADTCGFAHTDSPPLTCWFWKNTLCNKREGGCPYAHWDTGIVAPAPIDTRQTCYYWFVNGECNRTRDGLCRFAHVDTGSYALPPSGSRDAIERRKAEVARIREQQAQTDPVGLPAAPSPAQMVAPSPQQPQASRAPQLGSAISPHPQTEPMQGSNRGRSPPRDPRYRLRPIPVNEPDVRSAVDASPLPPPLPAGDPNVQPEAPAPRPTVPVPYGTLQEDSRSADRRIRARANPTALPTQSPSDMVAPTFTPRTPGDSRPEPVSESEEDIADLAALEADYALVKGCVTNLDLSPLIAPRADNKTIENVFLRFPPSRHREMELLHREFKKWNIKVYTSRNKNQWAFFRDKLSEGLIIVHPSETFQGTLPGLTSKLKNSENTVFSIGVQHRKCFLEDREPAYEAVRLFPNGGITLITDDVFCYYPEKATEIIEEFLTKEKDKPVEARSNKIGARPGIKEWLLRLAHRKYVEQQCEDDQKDLRWIKCYDAICRLCPVEDDDPHFMPDRSAPLDSALLWSIDVDEFPSLQGRWESGDEAGATDCMVELFAGEACSNAHRYRRFTVVYQRPGEEAVKDPQGVERLRTPPEVKKWMAKYSHLAVYRPDHYLQKK